MKNEIDNILENFHLGNIDLIEVRKQILDLHNNELSTLKKSRLDLLNFAKSELKEETNPKLDKKITPFRSDKIKLLNRIIDWINNEA